MLEPGLIEVRRDTDGELCGHVVEREGRWEALVVFGATLGVHDHERDAVEQVRAEGLAALADRWQLGGHDADPEVVCIQHADPTGATVALGYYSLPGVETRRVTRAELASGACTLTR